MSHMHGLARASQLATPHPDLDGERRPVALHSLAPRIVDIDVEASAEGGDRLGIGRVARQCNRAGVR